MTHDVGYIDPAMCCSPQLLVLGNELVGMVKHFMKGITINRTTLSREVIEAVGPGGQYLTQDQTMENFREQLWHSKLMDRNPRKKWEKQGAKDMSARVREKVVDILETHCPMPLDSKILDELIRVRENGEKELMRAK